VVNDAQVVDLSAADVMTALVKRETRRMRGFGREDGASRENPLVERLVALAKVRSGLDVGLLRSWEKEPPEGLSIPKDVIGWVEKLDWWSERDRALQPLRPDALGAALVFEVLKNRAEDAPEWLWGALSKVPEENRSEWLAAAERIDYDIRRVFGPTEGRFAGWLAAMVAGKLERAQALEYVSQGHRVAGTLDLSLAIERELLRSAEPSQAGLDLEDSESKQAERSTLLNNHSVHLSAQGKAVEALQAIEEAVKIHGRLAQQTPERYEPYLAGSLSNYSNRLREQGKAAEALEAIEEAVKIYGRLAQQTPERYEPDLAMSLSNYSVHLSAQGKAAEALQAIEEAVKIRRRLAEQTPERYEPDLALSLSVLGDRREEAGEIGKAMEHCEEALRLFRKNQEGAPGFVGRYLPVVERDLERLRGKLGEDE